MTVNTLDAEVVEIVMTRSEFDKLMFCLGYSELAAQKRHVRDVAGMARSLIEAVLTALKAAGGNDGG